MSVFDYLPVFCYYCYYYSVYPSIVSDTLLPHWAVPKGMGHSRRASPLFVLTFPLCLFKPLSLMYSLTPPLHLPIGLLLLFGPSVSFRYTFSQTHHSSSFQYDETIGACFFHPFCPSPFNLICTHANFLINALITFIVLSKFYSTVECCALFCIHVTDPYINICRKIYFLGLLFTSMDTFFSFINLVSAPVALFPLTFLTLILPSISPWVEKTVLRH